MRRLLVFFLAILCFSYSFADSTQSNIKNLAFEELFAGYDMGSSELASICKLFYESYREESPLSDEYIIPKNIHFVWLGSPLPKDCEQMVDTWRKFHPDWNIKVWTDKDAALFGLKNSEAFKKAVNYGEKSDIFRYEILYKHGGIYIDIDFECLHSFDYLHKSCEFYTGFIGNCLLNGLIGCRPGHPVIKGCIDNVRIGNGDHDAERIFEDTGPYLFTKMFLAQAPLLNPSSNVAFPPTFFYAFPATDRHLTDRKSIKQNYIKPESLAVHYWSSTWQVNKQ